MAINTFVQPDENGITRLPKLPQKQQQPYLGMPAPAPVQFNPGSFAPLIAPFAGAFNQASQAEATGIVDLRLQRMLESMYKQRQIASADAVLPYAGEAANLQNQNIASEINTRDQSLPALLAHLQAQTGLQNAQAGGIPMESLARLISAQGVQQGAQNDAQNNSLQALLAALSAGGPLGQGSNLDPVLQQVLRQRLGLPEMAPAAPNAQTAAPESTSLGSKLAALGSGAAVGASGIAGVAGGRALGTMMGAPLGPVGAVAGGITLPLLLSWLLNKNAGLAQSMNENPGTTGLGMIAGGAGGYAAKGLMKPSVAPTKPISGSVLSQPAQRSLPPQAGAFKQPPTTINTGVLPKPTPEDVLALHPQGVPGITAHDQITALLNQLGIKPTNPDYANLYHALRQ